MPGKAQMHPLSPLRRGWQITVHCFVNNVLLEPALPTPCRTICGHFCMWLSQAVKTETVRSAEPNIFTTWTFTESLLSINDGKYHPSEHLINFASHGGEFKPHATDENPLFLFHLDGLCWSARSVPTAAALQPQLLA